MCSCYVLGACHVCKNAEKGVNACVPVAVHQDECLQVYCHDVVGREGTQQRMMHRLQRRTYENMVRHTEL